MNFEEFFFEELKKSGKYNGLEEDIPNETERKEFISKQIIAEKRSLKIIELYLKMDTFYQKKYGPEAVTILEQGDFYELYAIDEDRITKITDSIGLELAQKNRDKCKCICLKRYYFAGFQKKSLSKYVRRLLDSDYIIIRVDQFKIGMDGSSPIYDRRYKQIYSQSITIEDINDIKTANNYIMTVYIDEDNSIDDRSLITLSGAISMIDVVSGKSILYEFDDNGKDKYLILREISRFISSYSPVEIIIYYFGDLFKKDEIIKFLDLADGSKYYKFFGKPSKAFYKLSYQKAILEKAFPKTSRGMIGSILEYLGLEMKDYLRLSYVLAIDYLYEQDSKVIHNLDYPEFYNNEKHLILSDQAVKHLGYFPGSRRGFNKGGSGRKKGSLFGILDKTSSWMGRRLLLERLINPITCVNELEKRYDLIDKAISLKKEIKDKIRDQLKIGDMERLLRKINSGILKPYEFARLDQYISKIKNLYSIIDSLGKKYKDFYFYIDDKKLKTLIEFQDDYIKKFDINKMSDITVIQNMKPEHNFIKSGINDKLDRAFNTIANKKRTLVLLNKKISTYIKDKIPKKEIDNKDFGFGKIDSTEKEGWSIQFTKRRWGFFKKEIGENKFKFTEVDGKTYNLSIESFHTRIVGNNIKITGELINKCSDTIRRATVKIINLIGEIYLDLIESYYIKYNSILKEFIKFIAELDLVICQSQVSTENSYCRPKIKKLTGKTKKSYIKCNELRHPIIEQIQEDELFVTNDCNINNGSETGMIITGLNGVGKSVYIKSVGIAVGMAQAGFYVAAKSFEFYPYQYLSTRIGNGDNILKGQSTFVCEMMELNSILKLNGPRTLVIADELCSGSEIDSAKSILATTIKWLSQGGSSFLFTTHIHGLEKLEIIKSLDNIGFYYLELEKKEKNKEEKIDKEHRDKLNQTIKYNRKLIKGIGKTLYGLEVCRYIVDNPQFIIEANKVRNIMLKIPTNFVSQKSSKYNSDLFVDKCNKCGKRVEDSYGGENLHTHHKIHQEEFRKKDGKYLKHNKNKKGNLEVLCGPCHLKEHEEDHKDHKKIHKKH